MKEEFLQYLKDWEDSVEMRKGYTPKAKSMMLIAQETRFGIRATGQLHTLYVIVNNHQIDFYSSQFFCGAPGIHFHYPWCKGIHERTPVTRSIGEILWMPEAKRNY